MGSNPLRIRPELWRKMVDETIIPAIGPFALVNLFESCAEVMHSRAQVRAREGKLTRSAHKYHWRDILAVVLYRLIRNPSLVELEAACGIAPSHQNQYFEKYMKMVEYIIGVLVRST